MKILRPIVAGLALCSVAWALGGDEAAVQVKPAHLNGPRELSPVTEQAAIRDYLESWKDLTAAFAENRPELLEADFTGTAMDKLTATIRQQAALGLRTRYQPRRHTIQVTFYSPEGLSIQLTDDIEYDVQVLNKTKTLTARQVHARYIAVLTPTEVRWRVRLLQASPE